LAASKFVGSGDIQWDLYGVPHHKVAAAQALTSVISEVTGTATQDICENLENSFYNVGGSSLNSVVVIVKLREAGKGGGRS